MSTFYKATQEAKKEGFTHIQDANGDNHPIPEAKTIPANLPKTGWFFTNYHGIGQCLIVIKKRKPIGFFKLVMQG